MGWKKKYRKAKESVKKVVAKDPMMGQFIKPKDSDSKEPASDQYAMTDVARSRAAGSGMFNYTDQEMRKV